MPCLRCSLVSLILAVLRHEKEVTRREQEATRQRAFSLSGAAQVWDESSSEPPSLRQQELLSQVAGQASSPALDHSFIVSDPARLGSEGVGASRLDEEGAIITHLVLPPPQLDESYTEIESLRSVASSPSLAPSPHPLPCPSSHCLPSPSSLPPHPSSFPPSPSPSPPPPQPQQPTKPALPHPPPSLTETPGTTPPQMSSRRPENAFSPSTVGPGNHPLPDLLSVPGAGLPLCPWIKALFTNKGALDGVMPFAYPVILGILETLVQMCMKAGSSMLLLTFEGENQVSPPHSRHSRVI